MKKSVFTIWLPATIIVVSVIVIVSGRLGDSDTNKTIEPAESDVVTEEETTEGNAWQDFLTGMSTEDEPTEELSSDDIKIDRQRKLDPKFSVDEQINSMNYMNYDLPKVKGRMVVRPMLYQRDFNRSYSVIRQDGLQNNGPGAWATIKFSPEMIGEEVTGIRFNDVQATEFLEKNGLEDADIIKEVNGSALNSPEAAFAGMNAIGESENLTLVIDRGGELITIEINK